MYSSIVKNSRGKKLEPLTSSVVSEFLMLHKWTKNVWNASRCQIHFCSLQNSMLSKGLWDQNEKEMMLAELLWYKLFSTISISAIKPILCWPMYHQTSKSVVIWDSSDKRFCTSQSFVSHTFWRWPQLRQSNNLVVTKVLQIKHYNWHWLKRCQTSNLVQTKLCAEQSSSRFIQTKKKVPWKSSKRKHEQQ